MIAVPVPGTGGVICIDRTESSRAHYREFAKAVDNGYMHRGPGCLTNFDVLPGPQSCADLTGGDDLAMTCIDWCDAKAYCEWAGKRLCGHIGPGELTEESRLDPAESEWQLACSGNPPRTYPYGDDWDADACAGPFSINPYPVGNTPTCVSPDGVLDLTGNVSEWTSFCQETSSYCSIRDSAHAALLDGCVPMPGSNIDLLANGKESYSRIGVRCCADAM